MMKHWIVSSVDDTLESFLHWWYLSQVLTLINISVLPCFSDCFQMLQHAYFVFKMRSSLSVSRCCSMLILCSTCELLWMFQNAAACLLCVLDAGFSECFQMLQHAYFVFKMQLLWMFSDAAACIFCVNDASFSDCFQMLQHAYFSLKMRASLSVSRYCSMLIFK